MAPLAPNEIYQFSLLNALMDGVSESGIPVSKLLTKGNQGIGTFSRMDGELLFLEGKVYQLQASGRVREASPTDQIPFAVSTQFDAEHDLKVNLASKEDIDDVLQRCEPHARNLFLTYRVDGRFAYVKARTVRGQEYKGEPLSALGKRQSVEEYEGVEGTVVGFRTPGNWQGFGVAGEHLHFVDGERSRGGHVLELRSEGEVRVRVAVASEAHVELPRSRDFDQAKLVTDDAGVREVEG